MEREKPNKTNLKRIISDSTELPLEIGRKITYSLLAPRSPRGTVRGKIAELIKGKD